MDSRRHVSALVLRKTNYGEADRIVDFLTPDGRVSAIARGARREKSKLAGGIELFSVSDITVRPGRGELGMLTSARLEKFYSHIMTDYDRMQFGYEAIRQMAKASAQVNSPEWFDVLVEVYRGLDAKNVPLALTQTWFYLHYAELEGYQLSFERDVNGDALTVDRRYMYDSIERGLRPSEQGELTADHIKYMRLIAAKPLTNVAQVGGVDTILDECWVVARQHTGV